MRTIFIIVLLSHTIIAQDLHDWQVMTYMNDVTDVEFFQYDIWVSSTGGVYRFNPSDSMYTKYTNIDGLASLDLTSLSQDNYGNLLVGSRDGIICMYRGASDSWDAYYDIRGQVITDLLVHGDTLWVATNEGIGVFLNRGNLLEFRDFYNNLPYDPELGYRVAIYNKHIFYATKNGILHAPSDFIKQNLKIADAWSRIGLSDGLPSNEILDLVISADTLYVGTDNGSAWLDGDFNIHLLQSWTHGYVNRIIVSDHSMYLINRTNIFKRNNGDWYLINSLEQTITSGVIDDTDDLWLGLAAGGLRKNEWSKSFKIDGPATNHVGVLLKDQQGTLWMASGKFKLYFREGFYKYDFNKWTNYKFYDNLWTRKNNTDYIYEDKNGNIWIGTWGGGVTVISGDKMVFYHAWPEDGRLVVSDVSGEEEIMLPELPAADRNCLVGAQVSGTESFTVITHFLEDIDGNLWCSNYLAREPKYLAVIPNSELIPDNDCSNWKYFGDQLGMSLEESTISSLEFDMWGRLWMGTFQRGILVLDYNGTVNNDSDDRLYRINMSTDNLFSNTILCMQEDLDGIIWIGTDGGLNSYQADVSGTNQVFYKHVGDVGPIENKINQIFVDKYNNKWFATDGGLSILKGNKSPWDVNGWIHYTTENSGLPSPIVNSVFVDEDKGEAYIGTESGLAIFSGPYAEFKTDLEHMLGGPNPFVLANNMLFTIKNLVPYASVKILNINGQLIRELTPENGMIQGSRATWDGKDSEEKLVASGIYIYLVYNDEGVTGSGKIAVIKP